MRIVFLQIWHGEKMGYIDRFLPAAMAELGHDVHLVATDVQPYFTAVDYATVYEPHFGPPIVPCGTRRLPSGVTLHRLPHGWWRGRLRIRGLLRKLTELRPDIVQDFELNSMTVFEAALYRPLLGYALFTEAHVHASVFAPATRPLRVRERLAWGAYRHTWGALVSRALTRCYPISSDAADIAVRFFGVDAAKVQVVSLGTDTRMFRPAISPEEVAARNALRERLGFAPDDIVRIYTGRLTREKGPQVLAEAVKRLRSVGAPYRALFIGHGAEDLRTRIAGTAGCVVHPFVPADDLPPMYRAADIGVWPQQESTSQLDAAAAGLPLVLSDRVQVRERVDGNGLMYAEGDGLDLAAQLARLRDPQVRRDMAEIGRRRMVADFDWRDLARGRLADYAAARIPRGRRAPVSESAARGTDSEIATTR